VPRAGLAALTSHDLRRQRCKPGRRVRCQRDSGTAHARVRVGAITLDVNAGLFDEALDLVAEQVNHAAAGYHGAVSRSDTRAPGTGSVRFGSPPGIVVERNRIIQTHEVPHRGIQIPTGSPGAGDDADRDAIVRDNTVCFPQPHEQSIGVHVTVPNASVTRNVTRLGSHAQGRDCVI